FGEYWLPVIPLIPLLAIPEFLAMFDPPLSFTQLNHPLIDQALGIAGSTISFIWYLIIIYVLKIQLNIYIFLLKDIPIIIIFKILTWIIIDFKILKIRLKDFFMQAYLLPSLALSIVGIIIYSYGKFIFPIGQHSIGAIPFTIISLLAALFLMPPFCLCPLLSIFGAWDRFSIESFEKAIPLCGPSKWLLKIMYKTSLVFWKISPLKDRFPVKNADIAFKEAIELQKIKIKKDISNIKSSKGVGG
ncbi:MAG: hypothetical protein ACTSRA_16560, partial [Promethearchaeota archaeon]